MAGTFLQSKQERAMAGSIVAAIAFLGFWAGVHQTPAVAEYKSFAEESSPGTAEPARTNKELSLRPWSSDLPKWAPSVISQKTPITRKNTEAYLAALDRRSQRRAYEGAPPTIPHPISQGGAQECLICHKSGASIGSVSAPPMSHKTYAICTQCHIPTFSALPQTGESPSFAPMVKNSFLGLRGAPAPWKMAEGSPPQQPHRTFMRENCISCHGPQGLAGLQTSHPERKSCQQCHAPSAKVDQRMPQRSADD